MPTNQSSSHRQSILAKYHIFHDGRERRRPGHEKLFENIVKLGGTILDDYKRVTIVQLGDAPWRAQTIERASVIRQLTARCIEQQRNEAGWRLALEQPIFDRFTIEVVCEDCRARLWRSEIEANMSTECPQQKSLEERKLARQICRCPPDRKNFERRDDGLNEILEWRSEESIVHEEAIMHDLQKRTEIPDLVWGLRTTDRLGRILDRQRLGSADSLRDTLTASPFKDDAGKFLYPFLVLETKSDKSADNFPQINSQTGFIVRNLLNLQYDLVTQSPNCTQESLRDESRPLVWVLTSKGPHWRVSGAYIYTGKYGLEYRVLDLWDGHLNDHGQSLQLLLIIDHIFDWARDVYRRTIKDTLLSLVKSPTRSLCWETDTSSLRLFQPDTTNTVGQLPETCNVRNLQSAGTDTLSYFDRKGMALRDSRHMLHKVIGVQITGDNWDEFWGSIWKDSNEINDLANGIFEALHEAQCWYVTAECLNALGALWTGCDRESTLFLGPHQQFLTYFSLKSFIDRERIPIGGQLMDNDWLQVHQLEFVAIALDAFQQLKQKVRGEQCSHLETIPTFSTDEVVELFRKVRLAPTRQLIGAALQSTLAASSYLNTGMHGDPCGIISPPHKEQGPTLSKPSGLRNRYWLRIPGEIYSRRKTGTREPDDKFLRVSLSRTINHSDSPKCTFWPESAPDFQENELSVLASRSTCPHRTNAVDLMSHCLFLLPPTLPGHSSVDFLANGCSVGAYRLEMPSVSGQPSWYHLKIRSMKSNSRPLRLLYDIAEYYFEQVQDNPMVNWRHHFPQISSHSQNLSSNIIRDSDSGPWLDAARKVGVEVNLEEVILALVEAYKRAYAPNPEGVSLVTRENSTASCELCDPDTASISDEEDDDLRECDISILSDSELEGIASRENASDFESDAPMTDILESEINRVTKDASHTYNKVSFRRQVNLPYLVHGVTPHAAMISNPLHQWKVINASSYHSHRPSIAIVLPPPISMSRADHAVSSDGSPLYRTITDEADRTSVSNMSETSANTGSTQEVSLPFKRIDIADLLNA